MSFYDKYTLGAALTEVICMHKLSLLPQRHSLRSRVHPTNLTFKVIIQNHDYDILET